jgi:hypothetical protein
VGVAVGRMVGVEDGTTGVRVAVGVATRGVAVGTGVVVGAGLTAARWACGAPWRSANTRVRVAAATKAAAIGRGNRRIVRPCR